MRGPNSLDLDSLLNFPGLLMILISKNVVGPCLCIGCAGPLNVPGPRDSGGGGRADDRRTHGRTRVLPRTYTATALPDSLFYRPPAFCLEFLSSLKRENQRFFLQICLGSFDKIVNSCVI